MQDRHRQFAELSCDARPDHTFGSKTAVLTDGRSLPVYPQLQACRCTAVTDAMCADDERAAALRNRSVDIAAGDFTDIDDIRAAMEGINTAYSLHPIAPGIIGAAAYFAQAAQEVGVTAIVNMSQISARRESMSHAAQDHWASERVFDWSGVATTHLRPTLFAE